MNEERGPCVTNCIDMKKLTLLGLVLGALFFIPTGAFAKDKHHHHSDHHDWSRDHRDYRDYRSDDRDYWQTQRDIVRDRLNNGYNPDGSPRYQNYRYYYRR